MEQLEGIAFSAAQLIPDTESSQSQFMAIADGLYVAGECGGLSSRETEEALSRLARVAHHAA